MDIIKTSRELNMKETYALTMGASEKMADMKGEKIEVNAWCHYEDADSNGEIKNILAVLTPEGKVYSTISDTFKREFFKIADMYESYNTPLDAIVVTGGTSKSGREFVSCTMAM